MKKRIVINTVALMVVASAGTYFSLNRVDKKEYFTVTQLANIDALVQTEGEEGTPVGNCHIRSYGYGGPDWYYFCNSATTDNLIFPCPTQEEFGTSAGTTKCTK